MLSERQFSQLQYETINSTTMGGEVQVRWYKA